MQRIYTFKPIWVYKLKKQYLPGNPKESKSLPKDICKDCLGTIFSDCRHNNLMSYLKYCCNFGNMFFLFCDKYKKHENAQDWMRVNHDPNKGVNYLYTIFNSLGSDHVQINSITVAPETQRQ